MADDPMFAPLPGARRRQQAEPIADAWHPIRPVPDDAPAAPQQHYRHGKPSCRWTYLDAAGKLLGYVLRFDLNDGSKEFAPLTCCASDGGRREWRWKPGRLRDRSMGSTVLHNARLRQLSWSKA